MSGTRFRSLGFVVLGFLTAAMAACSPDASNDINLVEPELTDAPLPARVYLVKFGPEGTTATFEVTSAGGLLLLGDTVTIAACPRELMCGATAVWSPVAGEGIQEVTVKEIASTGNTITERISIISELDGLSSIDYPTDPTVTVRADRDHRATVRFKNIVRETPPEPSLRVVKSAASETVTAGGDIGFNMDVYSDGPGTATNVTLTDALPAGNGVSWSTSSAGCSVSGSAPNQTLNCSLGDMAAGAHVTVSVSSATSNLNSCGHYPNAVSVSADNHGTVGSQASLDVIDCYQPPSLRVTKSAASANVSAGGTMTFNMTVYSDGPGTANGVVLSDVLPGGNGVNWSTSTAGCAVTGAAPNQTLTCNIGNMAANTSKTVSVSSATSTTGSCGTYNNTVNVSSSNHGTVSASASINVSGCTTQGSAGCTPGFWKQSQHFAYWTAPYTPNTQFSAVFANAFPGKTLLQVLGQGGGGIIALGRHTVAALLNGASPDVDYGMTAASVIATFNAAYASGNATTIENAHLMLAGRNERGCTAKD